MINAIYPAYVKKLGLFIRPTEVGVQEIDNIILDTYEMVVIAFLVMDKANRVRFFEESFLVANVSPRIIFVMFFLTMSSVDIDFSD